MSDDDRGLILLKCHGCKAPTLFKLDILRKGDSTEYVAKTHCMGCERENPLKKLVVRKLEPELVKNQRIDAGCLEPDRHDEGEP